VAVSPLCDQKKMTVSVGSFRRSSFFAYVLTDLIEECRDSCKN
jgi:hypothetical protein